MQALVLSGLDAHVHFEHIAEISGPVVSNGMGHLRQVFIALAKQLSLIHI